MWVCESCGAAFPEPKSVPFYREYFDGCPECDSLLISQDATQCICCEEWHTDEDMVGHLCKACLNDILSDRQDLLISYALEDVDAFSEFAEEKLREEKKHPGGNKKAPKCGNT